jgi:outer membrane protein OmpA-like peptidoglycan-associated protein
MLNSHRLAMLKSLSVGYILLMVLTVCSQMGLYAQDEVLDVHFEIGAYKLTSAEKAKVKETVDAWIGVRIKKIDIEGYCDDTGSEVLNFELSENRAAALYEALSESGIDTSILNKKLGRGSIEIENVGSDLENQRKRNRRASAYIWFEPKSAPISLTEVNPVDKKSVEIKIAPKPLIMGTNIATGDRFTLDKVLFVGSRDIILASSYGYLKQFIEELTARPDVKIKIEGHVCCTKPGQDGVNAETKKKNLSYVRAKAVYDYLAEHGIEPSRMTYEGMKGDYPLGGDPSLDRRVEIIILESNN